MSKALVAPRAAVAPRAVTTSDGLYTLLVRTHSGKDERSRLRLFCEFQAGRPWYDINLIAYRDRLLSYNGFAPSSVAAHLSSVRAAYRAVLRDNDLRKAWLNEIGAELRRLGQSDSAAERTALLREYTTRISNAIDPAEATVKILSSQDLADSSQVRLTRAQAESMLIAPGVDTPIGLRDTSLLALMLCTGLREMEAAALEVRDLRQKLGGSLALHVREGKGNKARLIPYGDLVWCLAIVDRWLASAGIENGKVLRAFWRSGKLRDGLSVRAIENIVKSYTVADEAGRIVTVRPHDLRRTYARRQYEAGLDLVSLSQNLGHSGTATTLLYIGSLDGASRSGKLAYNFDTTRLR